MTILISIPTDFDIQQAIQLRTDSVHIWSTTHENSKAIAIESLVYNEMDKIAVEVCKLILEHTQKIKQ